MINNQDVMPDSVPSSDTPTAPSVTGRLVLIFDSLDRDGRRSIAIQREDEKFPADDMGRVPLRGIKLSREKTAEFDAAVDKTIFKGQTVLTITVETTDLEADLATGHGIRGMKLPYLIGTKIMGRMTSAVPTTVRELSQQFQTVSSAVTDDPAKKKRLFI